MKTITLICTLTILLYSCQKKEAKNVQTEIQLYGATFDSSKAQDISNLSSLMNNKDSVTLTLSGEIVKTCAAKGCWMQVKTQDQNSIRVTFKDYAFFVPKSGVEGKNTTINGYCIKQETSVDELRHYAKDAGESEEFIAAITEPKLEFSFVANGVIIED